MPTRDTPRNIYAKVEYPGLHTLVLYRSNKEIRRERARDGFTITWADTETLPADKAVWYYIRAEGRGGAEGRTELAWASPIWVSVKKD